MSVKHTTYLNLLEALKEGCPLCFLVRKTTQRLMADFLYESVNDPGIREDIKASQGFCNRHAWQLQKFGDGLGQAIIYSDLMNAVSKELKERDESVAIKELVKSISHRTTKKRICIFCRQEKDTEERYVSVFWESFDDLEFSLHYKNSFGLCLPHLAVALKKCKSKKFSNELVNIESQKLSNLIGELKEFMRKHDYRFSQEKFGKEGNSWIRAVEKSTGKEGT
jgi:hypothetical protein